jgi:hypothetical protein
MTMHDHHWHVYHSLSLSLSLVVTHYIVSVSASYTGCLSSTLQAQTSCHDDCQVVSNLTGLKSGVRDPSAMMPKAAAEDDDGDFNMT